MPTQDQVRFRKRIAQLRNRCDNPNNDNYYKYGARGITYDPELCTVEGILDHMGPPPSPIHSIDRIDNDQGYFRGNLRWATPTEQTRNRRITKYFTINGITRDLHDWIDFFGLKGDRVRERILRGYGPYAAFYCIHLRPSPPDRAVFKILAHYRDPK